ncbi:ATP-dependent nuclease subunit B [Pedobacter yonginense]|uniref:ATP-dependent nuclease subunit B n=1 Tax=Pedobacter yonginense TaxID=651869 RepID=A0A317EP22_9SPHI|nr:PD-(D/E)XK nuclease family protein [Pedobacter yonginense]PWS27653.1 ATP-dependent nuclease subunit B [Pedobacter yonginense]
MKAFLQEVAEDLVAKFGQSLQDCAIVFNNKRPTAYLQKHLADIYKKPFWSPAFFTVSEFFAESTHLKIADHYTQFFTLYDCYIQLLKQEGMEKFPSIAKFHNIAKIILGDFSQIDNDLVDANKLFTELEDIALINQQFDFLTAEQKNFLAQFWQSYSEGKFKKQQELFIKMWHRMPLLYHEFHQQLKAKDLITMARLYKNIAENTNEIDFTAKYEGKKLIFIGFNALSKAEAKAFKRWQEEDKAIFYFDTDSYYLEDEMQEAGLFLRRNLQQIGLVNQLSNDSSSIKSAPRQVSVFKVQGQTAQAKIVNELLTQEKEQILNNQPITSTAIILADESLLIPLMQTIPSTVEDKTIDVNITMGFGLANSSLYGLVDLWLTVQSELNAKKTVRYQTAEAFLSHPLTGISEIMRPKIIDALIREQLIEIPYQRLTRQGGLLAKFFEPVNSTTQAVVTLNELLDYVLHRELANKSLKRIDAELFGKTIQELNRLQDTLQHHIDKYNKEIELSFVFSLIQKSLAEVAVPLEGDPLSGIQIMGLLESRNLNFDRVVILGLNEGIVPQATTATTFIPDSLRRVYGLPVLENQDAISAYMFYRLIQRAQKLNFVYNSLTDESNSGEPSRFIKQLEYESGFTFSHQELQLAVKTELKREEIVVKSEKVKAVLNKYLSGQKYLSASALTTYISNPIDFFYKYIAGIEEPKEVEETVEANKVGLILHYAMEQFYEQLRLESPEITAERIQEKRKDITSLILEGFADCMYADKKAHNEIRMAQVKQMAETLKLNGMEKIVFAIVNEYINIILKQDTQDAPFTLIGLEQKGNIGFQFEANGVQQQVKLYGIIDRVDLKNGIYRIVDYKTGSDKLKYSSIEECFDTDCGNINKALIQTLFYTHVYEQISKNENVEPNLYVVKNMRKEGIHFTGKGGILKSEFLAAEKQLFLNALREKLKELFDFNTPFRASQNSGNYVYSIYTTLFGR